MKRTKVNESTVGKRVDVAAGEQLPELSRSYIARLIEEERITLNGEATKPGYKLRSQDTLQIDFEISELDKIPLIDLPVLYEDSNIIVIDKPAGVISHSRGRYWNEPSVASFIRARVSGIDGERAGIVHRLDRGTSGVMVCAKNPKTLSYLQVQFSKRQVEKTYIAVCEGVISPSHAIIDAPITRNPKKPTTFMVHSTGKPAQTSFTVIKQFKKVALVEFKPFTGRTHQLRVHAAFIKHPIVGDVFYGAPEQSSRLYLHAYSIKIMLPDGKFTKFKSALPDEFNEHS